MPTYRCPGCQKLFRGMLRYCPYCGTKIRYKQDDYMAIDNYSDSKSARHTEMLGAMGQLFQSIGCLLMSVWFLVIVIIIAIALI